MLPKIIKFEKHISRLLKVWGGNWVWGSQISWWIQIENETAKTGYRSASASLSSQMLRQSACLSSSVANTSKIIRMNFSYKQWFWCRLRTSNIFALHTACVLVMLRVLSRFHDICFRNDLESSSCTSCQLCSCETTPHGLFKPKVATLGRAPFAHVLLIQPAIKRLSWETERKRDKKRGNRGKTIHHGRPRLKPLSESCCMPQPNPKIARDSTWATSKSSDIFRILLGI